MQRRVSALGYVSTAALRIWRSAETNSRLRVDGGSLDIPKNAAAIARSRVRGGDPADVDNDGDKVGEGIKQRYCMIIERRSLNCGRFEISRMTE